MTYLRKWRWERESSISHCYFHFKKLVQNLPNARAEATTIQIIVKKVLAHSWKYITVRNYRWTEKVTLFCRTVVLTMKCNLMKDRTFEGDE